MTATEPTSSVHVPQPVAQDAPPVHRNVHGESIPPLGLWRSLAYAIGGGGWVMVDRLLLTYATVFFLPPGDNTARLPDAALFLGLTLWGAISLGGRVVDSITDPLMAALTDRSTASIGRRRFWMLIGIVPLCGLTAALFMPPDDGPTTANAVYVGVVLTSWYVAYTIYNVPYTAFLADLGQTSEARLSLSIYQAVFQIAGAACVMIGGNAVLGLYSQEQPDGTLVAGADGYAALAALFAGFAALWMLMPVAVNERRFTRPPNPSKSSPFADLFSTLKSSQLRWFLLGTVSYWFGFNTVAQCVNYYVIVLMGKDEGYAALVLAGVFVVIGVTFPVVAPLSRRFTRRRVMIVGALAQALLLCLVAFIQDPVVGTVLMACAGVPTCFVMCVPNSLLADLAEQDARESGKSREAMVFAAQAFFLKVNLGVTTALIAGLLTLGRSVENPLGIRLTGPVAGVVLLISAFAYWRFREPEGQPDENLADNLAPAGAPEPADPLHHGTNR